RLEARAGGLRADRVLRELAQAQARADTAMARLHAAWDRLDERRRKRLEGADRLRQTLGYRETLKRGYAVVRGDGAVVTRKAAGQEAEALEIEFHDGRLAVGGPGRGGARPAAPKGGGKGPPAGQGSLF
ncbi:exodeoxyribonuclease VII large subunit, partial [Rhodobacteraceae bacterium WD3A24]